MSYILDALRKADQARRDGEAPSLALMPDPPAHVPRGTRIWIPMLAIATFAGGILFGAAFEWQGGDPNGAGAASIPLASRSSPEHHPVDSRPPSVRQEGASGTLPAPALSLAGRGPGTGGSVATQSPMPQSPGKPHAKDSAAKKETRVAGSDIPEVYDLPQALRRALPALSVGMHAYSAIAENRLASVDGTLLQEGSELAPGLRLESITPTGLIFSHQGRRFRIDVRR